MTDLCDVRLSDPYKRPQTQTETAEQVEMDDKEEEVSEELVFKNQKVKLHKILLLIF